MTNVFIIIVLVFIVVVSVFSNIVKSPQILDNKGIKSMGVTYMKKILVKLIEKFEQGKYMPFDTHEPIVTNSRK